MDGNKGNREKGNGIAREGITRKPSFETISKDVKRASCVAVQLKKL